jgi:hypothetical protein
MRSGITLVVAYLLLILQSTVLELAPVRMAAPGLGLLVVMHVGLSGKWSVSSAVFARVLAVRVAVTGIVMSAAVSFVASLLSALLIVIVRAQVAPEGGYGGLRQAPIEAVLTAIAGPFVLGLLRRIDGKIDQTRSRVGLARGPRSLGDGMSFR